MTKHKILILRIVVFGLVASSLVYFAIVTSTQGLSGFYQAIADHELLFNIGILLLKALSIIYPPLPGSLWTAAAIPFVGWKTAYAIDLTGSVLGAITSFHLGKKYGQSLLTVMLGQRLTNKVMAISLKNKKQVEAAIVLRLASGGVLSDGLVWGASLIGFKLVPFMIGYVISHLLIAVPLFYAIGHSLESDSGLILLGVAAAAAATLYYFRGRYFE